MPKIYSGQPQPENAGLHPPDKVTISWLRDHVPVTAWIILGTTISTVVAGVFFAGIQVADTDFVRQLSGKDPISRNVTQPKSAKKVTQRKENTRIAYPSAVDEQNGNKLSKKNRSTELKFSSTFPVPVQFENFTIGTKVSKLASVFPPPRGDLEQGWYWIRIDEGPFEKAIYYFDSDSPDPEISSVLFWLYDKEMFSVVVNSAKDHFGIENMVAGAFGKKLTWPNAFGYRVVIDGSGLGIQRRWEAEEQYGEKDRSTSFQFSSVYPVPVRFEKFTIGTKISIPIEILQIPKEEINVGTFSLDIEDGPFDRVVYYFDESSPDAEIDLIIFWLSEDRMFDVVTKSALEHFGTDTLKISSYGKLWSWLDVYGVELEITSETMKIRPHSDDKPVSNAPLTGSAPNTN